MIAQIEHTLKVLSDKNRMRILMLLSQRKLCVCELAFVLSIKQPSVSKHLNKLKQQGLIAQEQDSFWTNYVLVNPQQGPAKEILKVIHQWLKNDPVFHADLKRLTQAKRTQLCCVTKGRRNVIKNR